MTKFYRGLVSATHMDEAKKILAELTSNKLIAGGLISDGLSSYWWQGKLEEKTYYNISIFTPEANKAKIIELVRSLHSDEVPIIAFFQIDDANPEFLDWIKINTTA